MNPQKPQTPQTPQAPQKPSPKYGPVSDLEDTFGGVLDGASKVCLYGGLIAMVSSIIFLMMTYQAFIQNNPNASIPQGMSNIDLLSKFLYIGAIGAMVGSTYIWWGEETLGVFQLMLGGIVWSCPFWITYVMGSTNTPNAVAQRAVATIQMGGTIFGGLAIMVLVADIGRRVKQRAQQGSKADQLKYGKGVKEERDVKNVFMGKCWQLPFCRKFVRESCPIYHARRTCWRERVGCMCEEEVVRKAMSGSNIGVLSKDSVAASKFIPVNNRLSMDAKKERCRTCVIYNEHQKHKYKLFLGITVGGFVAFYVMMRGPLLIATERVLSQVDSVVGRLTMSGAPKPGDPNAQAQAVSNAPMMFQELLLVCVMIVVLAYVLKLLEFVVFKLKM